MVRGRRHGTFGGLADCLASSDAVCQPCNSIRHHRGGLFMRISSGFRAALIALTALTGASLSSAAYADSGSIRISVIKAGWIIGGSGGSGTLFFRGRAYPLSIGGISYGI